MGSNTPLMVVAAEPMAPVIRTPAGFVATAKAPLVATSIVRATKPTLVLFNTAAGLASSLSRFVIPRRLTLSLPSLSFAVVSLKSTFGTASAILTSRLPSINESFVINALAGITSFALSSPSTLLSSPSSHVW